MSADHSETVEIQKRLEYYARKRREIVPSLAKAKQVKEFIGELKKKALAVFVKPYLNNGDPVSAAEHKARASEEYSSALHDLALQYQDAERVIAEADALECGWESARSLLSMQRETLRNV